MALNAWRQRLAPLDIPLVAVLLLAALASFWLLTTGAPGERIIVEQRGKIIFQAPLDEERTATFAGPLGETVLSIGAGGARIVASSCPHHLCQASGTIGRSGELLACIPNRLLLRVAGAPPKEGAYDLLSR
jgi:hypothetical protein